jgi:hypothetical protein
MFIMHLLTPTLGKIGIHRGRGGNSSGWVGFGFGFERVGSNRVRVQVRAGQIGFGFKFERVGSSKFDQKNYKVMGRVGFWVEHYSIF